MERLDSWKEIAGFFRRGVRTVQRWEKTERLPVHRHLHAKRGSVYALRSELAKWQQQREASNHAGRDGNFRSQLDKLRELSLEQVMLMGELHRALKSTRDKLAQIQRRNIFAPGGPAGSGTSGGPFQPAG